MCFNVSLKIKCFISFYETIVYLIILTHFFVNFMFPSLLSHGHKLLKIFPFFSLIETVLFLFRVFTTFCGLEASFVRFANPHLTEN